MTVLVIRAEERKLSINKVTCIPNINTTKGLLLLPCGAGLYGLYSTIYSTSRHLINLNSD